MQHPAGFGADRKRPMLFFDLPCAHDGHDRPRMRLEFSWVGFCGRCTRPCHRTQDWVSARRCKAGTERHAALCGRGGPVPHAPWRYWCCVPFYLRSRVAGPRILRVFGCFTGRAGSDPARFCGGRARVQMVCQERTRARLQAHCGKHRPGVGIMLRGNVVDASDWVLVGGYDRSNEALFGASPYGRGEKPLPKLDPMPDWKAKTEGYIVL